MTQAGFDVVDVLYPDIALLARWARENGFNRLAVDPDPGSVLREMVRVEQPDIIFIYAGGFFHVQRDLRNVLRQEGPPHMIITGLWGDELHERYAEYDEYFGDLDFIFATSPLYQEKFEDIGVEAILIPASFDTAVQYEAAPKKDIDILFCGATGYRVPEHFTRYRTLRDVIPRLNVTVYANEKRRSGGWLKSRAALRLGMMVPGPVWKFIRRFSRSRIGRRLLPSGAELVAHAFTNAKRTGVGPWVLFDRGHPEVGKFDNLPPLSKLYPGNFHKPVVRTTDYHRLLTRAKIVINIHRDEDADIGNIRCFEVTGVGACLLTDRGEQLADWFKPGEEIASFVNADDLVVKARELLADPARLAAMAAAGQARTLREHTVAARVEVTAEKLKQELAKRASPEPKRKRTGLRLQQSLFHQIGAEHGVRITADRILIDAQRRTEHARFRVATGMPRAAREHEVALRAHAG